MNKIFTGAKYNLKPLSQAKNTSDIIKVVTGLFRAKKDSFK